jgi:hypothetical protein
MSILSKLPILGTLWDLLGGIIKGESEPALASALAKHCSAADLDEIEQAVRDARLIKAGN